MTTLIIKIPNCEDMERGRRAGESILGTCNGDWILHNDGAWRKYPFDERGQTLSDEPAILEVLIVKERK